MIKMVALRTVYVPSDRREYAAGETFSVTSEVDAESFIRRKRAAHAVTEAQDRPKHVDVPVPTQEYRRRDMRAENPKPETAPAKKPTAGGQTGKARSAPSSRPGRRSKAKA